MWENLRMENLTHWCFEWTWVEQTEIASAGIFLGAIQGTHHWCVTLGLWARAVSHWGQWQVSLWVRAGSYSGRTSFGNWTVPFSFLKYYFLISFLQRSLDFGPAGKGWVCTSITKQNLVPLCCCCHKILHKLLPALLTKVWSLLPQGEAELWVHLLALASLNSFNLPISIFSRSEHWILD